MIFIMSQQFIDREERLVFLEQAWNVGPGSGPQYMTIEISKY